jgi:hypothetical protein
VTNTACCTKSKENIVNKPSHASGRLNICRHWPALAILGGEKKEASEKNGR